MELVPPAFQLTKTIRNVKSPGFYFTPVRKSVYLDFFARKRTIKDTPTTVTVGDAPVKQIQT
jgi:hypothetical protein